MPQAVSFGPYHHGDNQLKQMEEHKHRALLHFLKRSKNPIESYMDALHRVGKYLIDSYDWLDEANDDYRDQYGNYTDQFLQLMMRDMLMLQNQLPMLLLETLLGVESGGKPKDEEEFLNKIIIPLCTQNRPTLSLGKCLHVVDVYRKNLLQQPRYEVPHQTRLHGTDDYTRELYEAGIRFKTSKTVSLKDISFRCGVLRLSEIVVDDTTESTFLSLMAYERFHVEEGSEVTAYIFFMDKIIDSAKDVSLLHSKGIIKNVLGKDIYKIFLLITHSLLSLDNGLDEVHKKVTDYCKKKWNEWRANLIHTYFRSPWAVFSVLVAIFLMALTIVQTIYTIHPAGT
ncbi:hypothetical protein MKX01_017213 [Papaver californicum]|nr:hypothetical protein MKX01_017213 [Papaver californicum]